MRCDVVLRGGKEFTRFSGSSAIGRFDASRAVPLLHPSVPGNRTKAAYPCTKPKKNLDHGRRTGPGRDRQKFQGHGLSDAQGQKRICQRVGNRYTERKSSIRGGRFGRRVPAGKAIGPQFFCVPYEQYVKTTTG